MEKKLAEKVEQVKRENPHSEVGLWSQDEARFGLQPMIKKRWAKRGSRPIAEVNPQYQWTWSYGAVEMATGKSFFLLLPNLQAVSVELFLREFAEYHGFSKEKIAIVKWDGAPAHRANLEIPEGTELFQTSAHTPEMNQG